MLSEPIVFVVDDDAEVRESIRWLIESVGMKAKTFASAHEFLDAYDPQQPGCVVLDVRMPEISGLELQKKLLAKGIEIPTIIVSAFGSVAVAVDAMKHGAVDFIEKPFSDQAMLDRIHQAIEKDRRQRRQKVQKTKAAARVDLLTVREREVMDLVVGGKATKQIAVDLEISPKTVESHKYNIMAKLDINTITDLIKIAFRKKIITL